MSRIGLGLDIGGTATRWELQSDNGECLAKGIAPGLHGTSRNSLQREHTRQAMQDLLRQVCQHAQPTHVLAGITGYAGTGLPTPDDPFSLTLATLIPHAKRLLVNDILLSYFCAYQPGEGYLVYAGTGSMSAYVDPQHILHRAGGRGHLIDDAGAGYWMACQALQRIWRIHDERPEILHESPLAMALFEAIGGSDWAHTRQYIYAHERGDIGKLSIHIGKHVAHDPIAKQIVIDAGTELARLARVHAARHGPRPVTVAGGAAHIHPLYLSSLTDALPKGTPVQLIALNAQHHAARMAAQPSNTQWENIAAAATFSQQGDISSKTL